MMKESELDKNSVVRYFRTTIADEKNIKRLTNKGGKNEV